MELEYKFSCEDLEAVKTKAKSLGFTFSKKKHQIDTYVIVNKQNGETRDYLRIREEEGKFSLDYSRAFNILTTEEHETSIKNKETMLKILQLLGYNVVCVVDKQREEYVKDHITLTLDVIKDLGTFIEIEVMGEENDNVKEELKALTKEFDVKEPISDGYPDLLLKKA